MNAENITYFNSSGVFGSIKMNLMAFIHEIIYQSIGTHWIALYLNAKNVTYFDSFGVEHIPKDIRKFLGNKNITTNVYRIQAYNSIMCGYFCIGFIDFMLKGKSLLEYTNLFSLNEYLKNGKIISKYF